MSTKNAVFSISILLLVVMLGGGTGHAANDQHDNGSVPLLVRSRVALTPDVAASIASHGVHVSFVWPELNAMAMSVSPAKIADLAADPLVDLVETDEQGQVPDTDGATDGGLATSTDVVVPYSSTTIQTWDQDMADTVGTGYDGTGVTVAVVDSGVPQNWQQFLPPDSVDTEHAAGFSAEGWGDPRGQSEASRGVGGMYGLHTHGLAVASVIVGFPSEYGFIGGAAPGAKILPIRVVSQFNWGWFSWFTEGIMRVARLKSEGQIPGPIVINYSIWMTRNSDIFTSAVDYAISQGVVFVTVAGNFGPDPGSIKAPGTLPEAITAGAVGWTHEGCVPPACASPWFFADVPENDPSQVYVAGFSGRESDPPPSPTQIDVLAPGSFVFGQWLEGPGFSEGREVARNYVSHFIFGTSFAAPHVCGIVAQMLQKNPNLNQAQVEAILRASALPIPAAPNGTLTPIQAFVFPWGANATGAGLARAAAALAATPTP